MHASSSLLLLLVGLLTLWAELTPITGQGAPPATNNKCPNMLNGYVMPGQFCTTDASCPGNKRCCKMKNGQQCQLPMGVRWGYCPKDPPRPGQATVCLAECNTDEDCSQDFQPRWSKCCGSGCRRQCQVPEEEHPGVCLKRKVVQTFAPCNDTCADDRDCPLAQKCCFTGCRRGCLDPVRSERCQFPPETGPCRQRLKRYSYSPAQKRCQQFTYGGCRGNSNNFETKEACEEACGRISPEVCQLPSDSGPCLGYSELYYFNSTTKTCEMFVYRLCGGNGNRFSSKLECLMVCGHLAESKA